MESQPHNQGLHLTAYESKTENMNGTLVCDSMAASYLKSKGANACVVGANRVYDNGDTANKMDTFMLAIIAEEMGFEFLVASPFTTMDVKLEGGDQIEIEERPAGEMIKNNGTPKDMPCWNPAFDVTLAEYITGIISDRGC